MYRFGKYKILVYLFFLSVFYLLYSYRLTNSYLFNTDIARDSYGIIEIAQAKFTLIGPKLNFGGLYAGPYYYWLFAPILFLTKYSFVSILFFNASLFALALIYCLYKIESRLGLPHALLYAIAVGLLPLYIITARNPGNAYTYFPALLILLTCCYFDNISKKRDFLLLGIVCGVIVNFHFLNILVVCAVLGFLLYKSDYKKRIVFFFLSFLITFLPLLIFDWKHDFVILKKTFYDFSQNSLIRYYDSSDRVNLLARYLRNSVKVNSYILFNPVFYFILFTLPLLFRKHLRRDPFVFSVATFICFFVYVYLAKADMATHYFFSVGFLMFFTLIIFCLEYRLTVVIVLVIGFEILGFPTNLYKTSGRPFQKFENAVNFVVDNGLVDKNKSFNLIQVIGSEIKIPAGFEYRYFFRKRGYVPKTINEYNTSDELFVFLEGDGYDMNNLANWESGQFGQQFIKNRTFYEAGEIDLYKIVKE